MGSAVNPLKRHASEYSSDEVAASKRVLIEVFQSLGEYSGGCVLVGGWVPELLFPDADPKHSGSVDVDLALNPERMSQGSYAGLLDLLKQQSYVPGRKPFQLVKTITVGVVDHEVVIDLLLSPKIRKRCSIRRPNRTRRRNCPNRVFPSGRLEDLRYFMR